MKYAPKMKFDQKGRVREITGSVRENTGSGVREITGSVREITGSVRRGYVKYVKLRA